MAESKRMKDIIHVNGNEIAIISSGSEVMGAIKQSQF
jgi:hypothetical protein